MALVLWLFRRHSMMRRLRGTALITALAGGAYLVLLSLGAAVPPLIVQLALALSILLAANTVLQIFDWLVWDYLFGQRRGITVPRLIVDIFNFATLAVVALIVLNRIFTVDLSGFLVTSTVVSAVIGLALQDTLGNVITGLALQIEHPFTVGDWVKVNDQEGQVTQMSWRSVTLRTRDNHNVFIPNGNVAKQLIINYSRPTPLQRMHASVSLAYGQPPSPVKDLLVQAVSEAPGVAAEPKPRVAIKNYGDFAIQYDVLYWITDFANVIFIQDEVLTRVWYTLNRAHVSLPFPVRDVSVRMVEPNHEEQAVLARRRRVEAALRPIAILAPLTAEQITQLAETAQQHLYAPGEGLVREKDAGDSLFVLITGRVRVEKRLEDGQVSVLARMGPDDFFGEMSLLTGEPRSASVVAETEAEVIEVHKTGLEAIALKDPRILEALTMALEQRMKHSAEHVAAATGPLSERRVGQPSSALLSRVRRFFGIRGTEN
jgi:small-conductance mechanosensitive channel